MMRFDDLLSGVLVKIAKWASSRRELGNQRLKILFIVGRLAYVALNQGYLLLHQSSLFFLFLFGFLPSLKKS